MNFILYNTTQIKNWDKKVKNLVSYKLRENQYIGSNHWNLPFKHNEYSLFKLQDLQKICFVPNYLNYAANFIDEFMSYTTEVMYEETEMRDITRLL